MNINNNINIGGYEKDSNNPNSLAGKNMGSLMGTFNNMGSHLMRPDEGMDIDNSQVYRTDEIRPSEAKDNSTRMQSRKPNEGHDSSSDSESDVDDVGPFYD